MDSLKPFHCAVLAFLLSSLSCLLQSSVATAQAALSATNELVADSTAHAVDWLVKRYGYVITFEGPRFVNDDDYQDMPADIRRDKPERPGKALPRVRMSKAYPVTVPVPSGSTIEPQSMAAILRRLIDRANGTTNGHYRLEQNGSSFDVIPTEARDRDGNWVTVTPIFDTRITIARQERSAQEMLQAILQAVAHETHVPVVIFTAPTVMLASTHAVSGASEEPARVVLARTLSGMDRPLTWRAFYDAEAKCYFINIIVVPEIAAALASPVEATQSAPKPAVNSTQPASSPRSAKPSSH